MPLWQVIGIGLGVTALIGILYMRLEPYFLQIKKIAIAPQSNRPPVRFIHMTDFHVRRLYISAARIAAVVQSQHPDFIVLTGDYFESESEIDRFLSILRTLRTAYKKPVFLCFGNHDRFSVFEKVPGSFTRVSASLTQLGVTVLEGRSTLLQLPNGDIELIGLPDERYLRHLNTQGLSAADALNVAIQPHADAFRLMITHNIDVLLRLPPGCIDFAVAGHTHGAQIRSPLNLEIRLLHRRDYLSQMGYIRGLHRFRNIPFFIGNGLGCVSLPLRFLSPPQIAVLSLWPENQKKDDCV